MLERLLGGLGKNRELITVVVIVVLLQTRMVKTVLDSALPLPRETSLPPEVVTKGYVDEVIRSLDKLSAQRHDEAMQKIVSLTDAVKEQAMDLRKLSDRLWEMRNKHASLTPSWFDPDGS